MKINVITINNFFDNDLNHLQKALNRLQAVINSVHFQQQVIKHSPFHNSFKLSNDQIYEVIMRGQEIGSQVDFKADLHLRIDNTPSNSANGYVKDGVIHTFRNRFQDMTSAQLAGHYAHEYCHLLGFEDPYPLNSYTVQNNVPYEIGRIVTEIAPHYNYRLEMI